MRSIFLLIALIATFSSYSQETITWSESYRLRYEDFQGAIQNKHKGRVAETASRISIRSESVGGKYNLYITNLFKRNFSWMKPEGKNAYTLKHEQGHFDITEIYCRKMRKRIQEIKVSRMFGGFKIKRICKRINKQHLKAQRKYDKDTGFAKNEEKQEQWIQKIAKELKELEAYKDIMVPIRLK